MIVQFIINGIITGMIFGLVSLGFSLVYNTTRIFHIAYASVYIVAPYFLIFFLKTLGISMIPSILFALFGTVIIGISIDIFVYSPLERKKSSKNVIMVSSIGVMIVLINLVALIFGNGTKTINSELSKSITFGTISITHIQLIQFFISLFILTAFFPFLKFSRFGIQTRAYKDDESLVAVSGINTLRLKRYLYLFSAFFAATGSILVTFDIGFDPYVGMPMLLNAVVALIIGGIGRFEAAVLGGILLGILQSFVIFVTSANWQNAVTFLVLILFLLFRPQGILGEKERRV